MLEQERPMGDAADQPAPDFIEVRSKYEFVMAAAKEAERLNDHYRKIQAYPEEKVTVDACRRIRRGTSRMVYEEAPEATEDTSKENTYFFGA